MRISFELSERDVEHLRRMMRRVGAAAGGKPREAILGAARAMAEEVRKFRPPEYVLERASWLIDLIDMLEDGVWHVPERVERRILNLLAYFSNPDDLIGDSIPGLGFLDDAILVELVYRELRHEIEGYRDWRAALAALRRRPRLDHRERERREVELKRRYRSRIQNRERRAPRATGLL